VLRRISASEIPSPDPQTIVQRFLQGRLAAPLSEV